MPSLLFTLLTAASLLAHCVLGCCWHHAHGEEVHESAVAESGHQHAGEPHATGHWMTVEPDGAVVADGATEHEHGAECDEPDCSYLKSQQCSVPATSVLPKMLAIDEATPRAMSVGRALHADVRTPHRCSSAALRAEIQVWLV